MSGWTEGEWTADDQYVLAKEKIIGKARHCDWPGKTLYENYQEACANARMFAAAPDLYEALELATNELNIIRARDGAPQHIDWYQGRPLQTSSCTEEWWDELTEKCFAALKKARGD